MAATDLGYIDIGDEAWICGDLRLREMEISIRWLWAGECKSLKGFISVNVFQCGLYIGLILGLLG